MPQQSKLTQLNYSPKYYALNKIVEPTNGKRIVLATSS